MKTRNIIASTAQLRCVKMQAKDFDSVVKCGLVYINNIHISSFKTNSEI